MTAPLPLATPSDLGVWLGQTIAADDPRAAAVIGRASAKVRAYCGRTWLTEDGSSLENVPEDVVGVVIQVAARVWVNPQGLVRSDAEVNGRSWAATGETGIYLTDGEKDTLTPFKTAGRSGLWTLRTYRDECSNGTSYVPTGPPPAGQDFPWYADDVDQYGLHP